MRLALNSAKKIALNRVCLSTGPEFRRKTNSSDGASNLSVKAKLSYQCSDGWGQAI